MDPVDIADDITKQQSELREEYLRWLQQQETRLSGEERSHIIRPGPDRANVNACTW